MKICFVSRLSVKCFLLLGGVWLGLITSNAGARTGSVAVIGAHNAHVTSAHSLNGPEMTSAVPTPVTKPTAITKQVLAAHLNPSQSHLVVPQEIPVNSRLITAHSRKSSAYFKPEVVLPNVNLPPQGSLESLAITETTIPPWLTFPQFFPQSTTALVSNLLLANSLSSVTSQSRHSAAIASKHNSSSFHRRFKRKLLHVFGEYGASLGGSSAIISMILLLINYRVRKQFFLKLSQHLRYFFAKF